MKSSNTDIAMKLDDMKSENDARYIQLKNEIRNAKNFFLKPKLRSMTTSSVNMLKFPTGRIKRTFRTESKCPE